MNLSYQLLINPKIMELVIFLMNLNFNNSKITALNIKISKKNLKMVTKNLKLTNNLPINLTQFRSYFTSTTTLMVSSKEIGVSNKILSTISFIHINIMIKTQRSLIWLRSVWLLRCVRYIWASQMGLLALTIKILRIMDFHLEV